MNLKAGLVACIFAVGMLTSPTPMASAETVDLGDTADVDIVEIEIQQHWRIQDLQRSTDAIPYRPAGELWEATAAATLDHGGVPVISGFSARSGPQSYPVLWAVGTPLGIAPNPLPPGGTATGKIYFDVTGAAPTSVVYTVDGTDVAAWGEAG